MPSEKQPIERAVRIINELLKGRPLSLAEAREIAGVQRARGREIVESLRGLLGLKKVGRKLQLTGVRLLNPTIEQAIASSIAGAIADLFEGTDLAAGVRDAIRVFGDATDNPARFAHVDRKFAFRRRGGEDALPERAHELRALCKALVEERPIEIGYRNRSGEVSTRTVEPLTLLVHEHQLYLIARTARGVRPFRFARIESVDRARRKAHFKYPPREEYDVHRFFQDAFGVHAPDGEPQRVVIRMRGRWTEFARTHRWHESQERQSVEDGVEIAMRVYVCDELRSWVLSLGADAEVLEPQELRTWVRDEATCVAALYERAGDADPDGAEPA
jgi:predicted DNA-binding transcriptional regulator YafY